MATGSARNTATLEKALLRLEQLTATLDEIAEPSAREAARELLELTLDLHGLALARIVSIVAGTEMIESLIADPQVRAVFLLHGLHPHDAKARLRAAIERMHPQWSERGFEVVLLNVGSGSARIRLCKNGSAEPADDLRREVEEVMIDAAPDLDEIFVEVEVASATDTAEPALHFD